MGLSDRHAEWLEARGISCEVAAVAGVHSAGSALACPYPGFVKFRGPQKTFWIDPAGARLAPWLLEQAVEQSSGTLIWTEGELDALSFMTAGVWNVVSVPNGAPPKPGQGDITPSADSAFSYLWDGNKLRPEIAAMTQHILVVDADGPGQVLRDELAIRLGRKACWFVTYPDGCKDANDVLMKHGRDGVIRLLDTAQPIVPDQLVPFSAIPRSHFTSLSTGWSALDEHLRFSLPEVMVISGVPNAGKSQWALALVANLARVHGMRTAILQFEDDVDRHRDDLERYARAWQSANAQPIAMRPDEWIDRYFVTICPPESIDEAEDKSLAWMIDRIHEAATRHDCKVILIDPWNEIEHYWGINESETVYTGKALRQIRALARAYQLLIIVVAHPSKAGGSKPVEDMTLYDIAGSAHWANKPDHGVILHRERGADVVTVNVLKCRDYRRRGTPGAVEMRFNSAIGSFEVLA